MRQGPGQLTSRHVFTTLLLGPQGDPVGIGPAISRFASFKSFLVSGKQNNFFAQALQQGVSALRARQFAQAEQIAAGILKSNRTDRNAAAPAGACPDGAGSGRRGDCAAGKDRTPRR